MSVAMLAKADNWRPVLDLGGARFFQHWGDHRAYKRERPRADGSIEIRYACDDVIVSGIVELASRLKALPAE